MNFVSHVGNMGNPLDGPSPGHYHQTLVPSPRPQRRHTMAIPQDQRFLDSNLGTSGSVRSGLNDIHLAEFVKRNHRYPGSGHVRSASYAEKVSLTATNNNTLQPDTDTHVLTTRDLLKADDMEERVSSYGLSILEELPVHHNCRYEGCERVVINVSGLKFETQLRTLERLPHTLLGDPEKRKKFWNEERQELFFDRHRPTFQAVLYYYQSGGRLKRPLEVPMDIFINELYFYELAPATIEAFKANEGFIIDNETFDTPETPWMRKIWETLEYPESSWAARIFALFSVIFILTSVVTFCVETLPEFEDSGCKNVTVMDKHGNATERRVTDWADPLFLVETSCISFFVVELFLKFIVCPSKCIFLRSSINWIDLIAIAPYFVFLGIDMTSGSCGDNRKGSFLSVLRVIRVVRILKLSKHSQGLKILGKTMKTSVRELSMFILFLGIATVIYAGAIFYAEEGQDKSMFVSIPDAFWWAIVTMTTVGYGDYVPVGFFGKLLGGFCVLSGVLAIALPVPVIVANFNNYYRHYTGRRGKSDPLDKMPPK